MIKVLFVGLDYHGYTRAITEEMRDAGADVTFVDIQPRSFLFKVLRTVSKGLYAHYLRWHHGRAIAAAAQQCFDRVIFLQAHQMAPDHIARLRKLQPQATFVLYNWDSLSNHNYLAQAPLFDQVFTFDRADAELHQFRYLPLFCVRAIQGLQRIATESPAIYMVGNIVNTQRYHAVRAFQAYCREAGLTFRHYLKISPVVYFRLLQEGHLPRGVHFNSIAPQRFRELIESSAAVFDFANHQQSGQTMRTMESLCAGKKIITNNAWVKREDFFGDDRFHVYDGLDFTGVADFVARPLSNPDETFDRYQVQSFVRTLLGIPVTPTAESGT